jgi:hypothetical protein
MDRQDYSLDMPQAVKVWLLAPQAQVLPWLIQASFVADKMALKQVFQICSVLLLNFILHQEYSKK